MAGGVAEKSGAQPRARILAWASLVLGVSALGLVGWQGWDYRQQRRQMDEAVTALRQALAEAPQPGPDWGDQIEREEQALDRVFPAKLDLPALEQEIQKLAIRQGLALTGFEPLLAQDFQGYRLQSLRLTVLGSARPMAGLVKGLEEVPGIHRVRVDKSRGPHEGFQHDLYWDWYLDLPSKRGEEPCPEPKDRIALPPRKQNLLAWAGGNLQAGREEAEALKAQLAEALVQAQKACRQRRHWESLQQREASAQALAQRLSKSEP
jgi:hypothetical protein